jgi:hypothetical protein
MVSVARRCPLAARARRESQGMGSTLRSKYAAASSASAVTSQNCQSPQGMGQRTRASRALR